MDFRDANIHHRLAWNGWDERGSVRSKPERARTPVTVYTQPSQPAEDEKQTNNSL